MVPFSMMRKTILSTLILVVMMLSVSCATSDGEKLPVNGAKDLKRIYIVSHSWHAGIVFRQADIPGSVWPQHKDFSPARFIEVGWGDADFYQTPEPHFGLTIKAALLPSTSVLHIVGFSIPPTANFPYSDIIEIEVDSQGFEQLCRFIEKSYALDANGDPIILGKGLYGESRFYQSSEIYHICKTCNVWTAEALQAAGLPINPRFTFSVENLMSKVSRFGKVVQSKSGRL
jgi:uncharacterized protein (TIGR02117 family)